MAKLRDELMAFVNELKSAGVAEVQFALRFKEEKEEDDDGGEGDGEGGKRIGFSAHGDFIEEEDDEDE